MKLVHRARAGLLPGLALLVVASIILASYEVRPTVSLPMPPLKTLAAQRQIALGNFAIPSRLNELEYRTILISQFDFALLDNQPNWHFTDADLRPTPTSYDFSRIDQVMAFAQQHSMPVQAHHLIWGEEKWLPDWLKSGPYSNAQLLGLMHDHIMTVGQHYSGQIREWSVVNEAFTRNQHMYGLHDWWADHLGNTDYIDRAFIWAHQADPHAKLLLNDFQNAPINPVSDAMYTYIKGARERGVPIDGIGMQMHIDGRNPPDKSTVIANMRRFAAIGVQTYVTEFDVNMNDVRANKSTKDRREAVIYHDMVRACIESHACHSFAFLGITDKESWYNYTGLPAADPLLFDEHYRPKPAFFAVRSALLER